VQHHKRKIGVKAKKTRQCHQGKRGQPVLSTVVTLENIMQAYQHPVSMHAAVPVEGTEKWGMQLFRCAFRR